MALITKLNQSEYNKPARPVKVLQFGEGSFLRCFADSFIQELNNKSDFNGNILAVTPTGNGKTDIFRRQDSLYTVCLSGYSDGAFSEEFRIIDCITDMLSPYDDYSSYISYASLPSLKYVISNTTEAGIVYSETDQPEMAPPESFPGKLTQFLYRRFQLFSGSPDAGLIILPCELIDNNGDVLKETVISLSQRWGLEDTFVEWLNDSCSFHNTLVDRIVSGKPDNSDPGLVGFSSWDEKLGYHDDLLVKGERFGLWVIEGDHSLEKTFGSALASLPIVICDDCKPYKLRKVRILNGAHTAFASAALLSGKTYVNEAMSDPVISKFLHEAVYNEIIPAISGAVPHASDFAEDVFFRFRNPSINHRLSSICLNSVSKWNTRCLPTVIEYEKSQGSLPKCLVFSLAAIISLLMQDDHNIAESGEILGFLRSADKNDIYSLTCKFIEKFIPINDIQISQQLSKGVTRYISLINISGCYETMAAITSPVDQEH